MAWLGVQALDGRAALSGKETNMPKADKKPAAAKPAPAKKAPEAEPVEKPDTEEEAAAKKEAQRQAFSSFIKGAGGSNKGGSGRGQNPIPSRRSGQRGGQR
jgi:hypothetical protein